jgi:hypothetical protein
MSRLARNRLTSIALLARTFSARAFFVMAFFAGTFFAGVSLAVAQNAGQATPTPSEPPVVLMAVPFAVPYTPPGPGPEPASVKVVLRGLRLDNPVEVRVSPPARAADNAASNNAAANNAAANGPIGTLPAAAKILSSGAAAVPDKLEPKRVGDRQVEIALTLPREPPVDGWLNLQVVTAAGVSPPYRLLVDVHAKAMEEQEPNDGFGKAQALELASGTPLKLDGGIHEPRNVDVFRFDGRAGERLRGELIAARQGGPLDAFATLFDESGNIVFQADDTNGAADPQWDAALPRTGRYYLSLQDAHDRGGVLHRYRLLLEKR